MPAIKGHTEVKKDIDEHFFVLCMEHFTS